METRDHAHPEHERPGDGDDDRSHQRLPADDGARELRAAGDGALERRDDTAVFTLGDDGAGAEHPELHRLLRGLADSVAPSSGMRGDFYPQVLKRAAKIRRRRRAVRASSATAVLVTAAVLGPTIAHELGARGGEAVAAPPSAVVDLASAYPEAEPTVAAVPLTPAKPANALSWPSRGATLPAEAVAAAKDYLLARSAAAGGGPAQGVGAGPAAGSAPESAAGSQAGSGVAPSTLTATVTPLWAQLDDDTTALSAPRADREVNVNGSPARLTAQDEHKTWLFVMQGWTTDADGTPSQAVLLVGEYTQGAKSSSMSMYSTPVAFAHARPGSGDDRNDTDQIAELSIWLPDSNRLLVLGAPQAKTVLYAKTGGDLIPQKTLDGVAVFPRTKTLVKGKYADTIQVRDQKNVALTPPKAWSAADFALSGPVSKWVGPGAGWVLAPSGAAARAGVPSQNPTPVPSSTSSGAPTTGRNGGSGGGGAVRTSPPSQLPASPPVTHGTTGTPTATPAALTGLLPPDGTTTVGFVVVF